MHVAVNAHLLAHTQSFRRAGVSHYTEQILRHLGVIDHTNRYTIYTTRGLDAKALGLPENFRVRPSFLPTINPRIRIPWEQFYAPLMLRAKRPDVFHGVLNVIPFFCPVPSVVTVHDLAFIRFPQTFRTYNRIYLDMATRASLKRAAMILAVSEHTKREIMGILNIPAERIVVTHNAVREHFVPPDPAVLEAFRRRNNLPEQFLLYVGTLEPRKNLTTLIEAFRIVSQQSDVPLIIGGGKGWLYKPIFERLADLQLDRRVRFAGYIPEEELPLWYAAATVFVFPSIYEGFGIPPLEAMACGTPVITTTSSSLPEVVGDAGIMVPPRDERQMADAILGLLNDADLRADLRERGFQRAKAFSWQKSAERTLEVYEQAAKMTVVA